MGPVLQEHTTSTILKRVPIKDKAKAKKSENSAIVASNNKTGGKGSLIQKPKKKTSSLHRNVTLGQEEPLPTSEIGHHRNQTKRIKSPNSGTHTMLRSQFESDIRYPRSTPFLSEWEEKSQKMQHQSLGCSMLEQNFAAREKNRRALSLQLAPHQFRLPETVKDLRLQGHKEEDTDSASDLSDSERLPVLPSPCTPHQLNLRAEIVESVDLHPHIPGPTTEQTENNNYSYPEFLPPPFNTWSLRQLAVFLNTDGKHAPRPKPFGPFEMFLERLLQLEWYQIETMQTEMSQPTAANVRSRGRVSNGPQIAGLSRPHTAPPTRLSSPKCMRPFPLNPSLGSPSSSQLSHCICCHPRYPLCSGNCSSYTYQRHSRLSPLLERKTSHSLTHKRSSSESRASSLESKAMGRPQNPLSPRSHKKQKEVAGNLQKLTQELSIKSKRQTSASKWHNGRAAEVKIPKDPAVVARNSLDKHVVAANKRDINPLGHMEQSEGLQIKTAGSGELGGVK